MNFRALLIIIQIIGCATSYSQGYVRLLDNTSWKYSWSYHATPYYQYWWHSVGDTVINGKDYVIIEHSETNANFIVDNGKRQYLREDSLRKMVYYLDRTLTSENVLYDFSLNIGDSIVPTCMLIYNPTNFVHLELIDTIITTSGQRRRLVFDTTGGNPKYLVEGIGWINTQESDFRVFDTTSTWSWHKTLNGCIYKNSVQQWIHPNNLIGFPNSSTCPCESMCPSIGDFDKVKQDAVQICPGDSVRIEAPCDTAFYWSTVANPTIPVDTQEVFYVKPSFDTTFLRQGSMKTDTVRIEVIQPITVDLGPDTATCENEPIVLSPIVSNSNAYYKWQNGKTTKTITTKSSRTYWVELTDYLLCFRNSDSMNYTALPLPLVSSLDSVITTQINIPSFTLVSGFPTGGTYYGTGVSGGSFLPPTAGLGIHEIDYVIVDTNGCSDTASFLIKVEDPIGISTVDFNSEIKIFPNPTNGIINIDFQEGSKANLNVRSMLGEVVYSKQIVRGKKVVLKFPLELESGIYILEFSTDQGSYIKKMVLEK